MQEGTLLCVNELTHKYPYQFEIFFKENYMKSKKILSAVLGTVYRHGVRLRWYDRLQGQG